MPWSPLPHYPSMDHFADFDRPLRLLLRRPKTVCLYGPADFIDRAHAGDAAQAAPVKFPSFRGPGAGLCVFVAEVTELRGKVDNALQVTEDVYLAWIYTAARLHSISFAFRRWVPG